MINKEIETPPDLAEYLADSYGIYHDSNCTEKLHDEGECDCRVFWVPFITERIRKSVSNERRLLIGEELSTLGSVLETGAIILALGAVLILAFIGLIAVIRYII